MTLCTVLIVELNLKAYKKKHKCDKCKCNDSLDNPLIEILDEFECVIGRECMMCYAERIDDGTLS